MRSFFITFLFVIANVRKIFDNSKFNCASSEKKSSSKPVAVEKQAIVDAAAALYCHNISKYLNFPNKNKKIRISADFKIIV